MKTSNTNFKVKSNKEIQILYEDNHIIAVNKQSSDIVQGDKTGDKPLSEKVKDYIRIKYNKPGNVFIGVVHRIDRPVSGVILFAKTGKALARLNAMFQEKTIQKTYWAIVEDKPHLDQAILVDYLRKNTKQNKSYSSKKAKGDYKRSELSYQLIASSNDYYLLEVKPKTGRHHQIRVQLSTMGCMIKGDLKYGAKRSNKDGSICLHAKQIDFIHPVKNEPIKITAPAPSDKLWHFFENGNYN
ncbi:RluA family pseudouridine synthase [Flavobacteriales bacterium]|nr:RluA family pseudouridine synthase [Flavobacteriales bacterium]